MKRFLILIILLIFEASSLDGGAFKHPLKVPKTSVSPACDQVHPAVSELLSATGPAQWFDWVEKLSGAKPVLINGASQTITSRYSPAMFTPSATHAQAYTYVRQQVLEWVDPSQVEEHSYTYSGATWKNLVVTLPGLTHPEEVVLLTAHLDSRSDDLSASYRLAPGAEDNASGAAVLLEAARLFSDRRYQRSVRLIWFSGEEQGVTGSQAYVAGHDLAGVVGVINLDMFGYDSNADHCFELHAGSLDASQTIGRCFTATIAAYGLDLSYDYLTNTAIERSDHGVFWEKKIGAIEVLENLFDQGQSGGCRGRDPNPNYHTAQDTADRLNLTSGGLISQAALATLANLAGPLNACSNTPPAFTSAEVPFFAFVHLTWPAAPGVEKTLIERSNGGCDGTWQSTGETGAQTWIDTQTGLLQTYSYRIRAVSEAGTCTSPPSACLQASTRLPPFSTFLPFVGH